jgi:hypothetical protein
MLHQILEANGDLPDRCQVLFQNTGREMPQTLDFVEECASRWSVEVTWLEYRRESGKTSFDVVNHNSASRNGEPFDQLIEYKKILPNALIRFCTVELKIRTAKRYLKSIGWRQWVNAVGIRADEPNRLARAPKKDCWVPWRPFVDAGVGQEDVATFWEKQPFSLGLPVINGKTMYGNCDGCFLKSEAQLAMLCREHPDRFDWWENIEGRHISRGNYGFFNKEKPLGQLKDTVSRQGDWVFDEVGYFCQADDGECTG